MATRVRHSGSATDEIVEPLFPKSRPKKRERPGASGNQGLVNLWDEHAVSSSDSAEQADDQAVRQGRLTKKTATT